jgi:hypothetical protein
MNAPAGTLLMVQVDTEPPADVYGAHNTETVSGIGDQLGLPVQMFQLVADMSDASVPNVPDLGEA